MNAQASARAPRDKAATRERILQAARRVFAARGYNAAGVDEIARQAGSSKGGVYFHFAGKQAIFAALIVEVVGLLEREVRAAIDHEQGALAKVDAALTVAIRTFSAHRDLTHLLLVETSALGPPFDQEVRAARGLFAAVIESYLGQAVAEGSIAPVDTAVAARVWLGAINEVVLHWLLEETAAPEALAGVLPALRSLLLRSIGVQPA